MVVAFVGIVMAVRLSKYCEPVARNWAPALLPCGDGSSQSIHLAAAFGSQRVVIVVVLKWGNEQHFSGSTGIEQFPAWLGDIGEAVVADEYHRDSCFDSSVNDAFLSRADGGRDKHCSLGKQSVTFAHYFLLAHAPGTVNLHD